MNWCRSGICSTSPAKAVGRFTRISNIPQNRCNDGRTVMKKQMGFLIALALIFSPTHAAIAQQAPLPIQDGQTLPLWSGSAPGALGEQESDIPAITVFLPRT